MIKKTLISLLALLFLVFTFGFLFIFIKNRPVSNDYSNKIFTVESGESIKSIAQSLQDSNLIRNKYVFIYYSYRLGLSKKIQAGTFKISPNASTKEIAVKLTSGGVSDYWIKILEGLRVEELNDIFPQNSSVSGIDFVVAVKSKEGYIYPDSYLIPQYFTLDEIIETIQNNFNKKFTQAQEDKEDTTLTDEQSIVLASLLEREGRSLESKKMIAGIILNRLEIGMPLQLDATIQYARDTQKSVTKYWQPITKTDLSISSPYNTYKNNGLPPSPICNPGFNSLYAALHPTNSDYLYYITGSDGKMYYAKTLEEHNLNIAKYLN